MTTHFVPETTAVNFKGTRSTMMVSHSLNSDDASYLDDMLREAVARKEFVLQYQPYLDLKSKNVAGVEALIRWQHPAHGLIYPDHFIPVAERSELIDLIGEWVLREACTQMRDWQAAGIKIPSMSVNVSPRQFSRASLPLLVHSILEKNNLDAEQLDLEVTESAVPLDEKMLYANVLSLRQLGVKISIDDFGMGYSSLERLRMMPVDRLKIDRVFIKNISVNTTDASLVRAMIHLGHQLGIIVIAEGIEDAESYARVQAMGCHQGQGFYFAPALSAAECKKYLRDDQKKCTANREQPSQRNRFDSSAIPLHVHS